MQEHNPLRGGRASDDKRGREVVPPAPLSRRTLPNYSFLA